MRQYLVVAVIGGALFWSGCGGGGSGGQDAATAGNDGGGGGTIGHGGTGGNAANGGTGATAGGAGGTPVSSFTIGGTVTGLAGSGLILRNNGADDLAIGADGAFTFPTKLLAGSTFAVTIAAQPAAPSQTCSVSGGSGTADHDVTSVAISCATNSYHVGGTVSGLQGAGLVLQDNGGDDLPISADGAFMFATGVASGATFTVSVRTQPTGPVQSCTIAGGSGTVGGGDVTSVTVNCSTNVFMVGGTVTGLAGTGLVLQNNGGDNLSVTANGSFAFATPIASGAQFAVTVKSSPTAPSQTCAVTGGSGTIASGSVNTIMVTCSTDKHTVGGTVSGLAGSGLVLQNNQGDNIAVSANGAFNFATAVNSGAAYAVTVLTQPSSPAQVCTVAGGSGTITSANVTNVAVTCVTSTYTVGGTVVGLNGQGLTVKNNGGDELAISANGAFTFATPVASGAAFQVTVGTQPSSPAQHCSVAGGQGNVGGAAVTSVVVNCATNQYVIGGDVAGLLGSGLQLALNGGTAVPVGADGLFAFPATVASGGSYSVMVVGQPASPWQTCSVSGGSGTVAATDIASVHVTCVTDTHTIGGMVAGLAGSGLVLQDNAGDDLAVSSSGAFTFATAVASGQAYAVTVKTQPTSPTQTCTVSTGSGAVANADITNVSVQCVTNQYAVGGSISGLAGSVSLQNGSDTLTVTSNGSFVFPTKVDSGTSYAVVVSTQPLVPSQTCTVTNGTGSVVSADISTVAITCVTNKLNVGGTVSGLVGSGLVLQDNGGDDLTIAANGAFHFATQVASGDMYAITVKTQPSAPSQTCTISGDSGTVGASDVTTVSVNCSTNAFAVGGTVAGLAGTGLVLTNNAGDDLAVSGNGSFAFATPVPSGSGYVVAVKTQPTSPSQTCSVSNGTGTVTIGSVNTVTVTCATNTYNVSATVTGLAGAGLVLQDNGGNNLAVAMSGTSTFTTKVASGQPYAVSVLTQPSSPTQTCTVSSPSGVVAASDVNVAVTCTTNTYSVGVTTSGLAGSGLVLQDNGGDDLPVSGNGTATFATKVASGAGYAVTVKTQPASPVQTCVVGSGTGTVGGANVTNVTVTCTTNTYKVGGSVTGLAGTGLVLQDNGGDDLAISANGTFAFATKVASGAGYAVTVKTQPSTPSQNCTVTGGSGTVGGADVTAVVVNCATNSFTVGGTVTGLAGSGLVLRNNGGDDLTISGNGNFAFATPIISGGAYAVTVKTQPSTPSQTCLVTSGSGTVTGAPVTTVSVACTTNTYNLSVTVTGLSGSGLVMQNNGGDNLSFTAGGTVTKTFATKVASGGTYSVSVFTQPSSPPQTCTITSPTGTMGAADLTLNGSCTTNSYTIGGTASGLSGTGLVLQDNGGDDLAVSGNGSFTFATKVVYTGTYSVTVKTQPSLQYCTVTSGSGTVGAANVTSVSVSCVTSYVQILVDCASNSRLLNTYSGTGCFGPVAAGGASYILMRGVASARLWSGSNCSGCSYTATTDTNFCSFSFTSGGCGGLNDAVNWVSIP